MGAIGAGAVLSPWWNPLRAGQAGKRRPNVVIIYTDDQPKRQFGCYGGHETPHIDRIASEGVRFDRFYVSTALCAPSRYGLQNGRYASSAPATLREFPAGGPGCPVQQIGDEHNRPAERFNLPWTMKQSGYATGTVGKWHQGFLGARKFFSRIDDLPMENPEIQAGLKHNFELAQKSAYAAGYDYAEAMYHDNVQINNFPACVRYHNQEWVTHKAIQFIEQQKDNPFFLVVNPTLVHYPGEEPSLKADRRITALGIDETIPKDIQPSRESVLERAQKRGLKGNHDAGMIWLDDAIGAIEKRIEKLGLKEDTILMVISDNGTGGKWTCYEGGVNTGCIMRWPGKLAKGKVSDAMIQNVDIAPTVFEMCGVKPAKEVRMHGVSQAGHLLQGAPAPRDSVYLEIGYQRAVVRKDGMKYLAVRFPDELQKQVVAGQELDLRGRKATGRKVAKANELYDIKEDPHERKNLLEKEETAKTRQELEALLSGYCKRLPHTFGEFTG
jgi:arylsulfatase A-like enzyme